MSAAALVVLLVAAIKAFPVVVSALVTTSVVAAVVSFPVMMAVVITPGIGIILERALGKSLCCCVGRAGNPAVELDPQEGVRDP